MIPVQILLLHSVNETRLSGTLYLQCIYTISSTYKYRSHLNKYYTNIFENPERQLKNVI